MHAVNSKTTIQVGIAFILLGIVAFCYPGSGDAGRDKASAIGLLPASIDVRKFPPLSPLTAGLVMAGGIVLVVVGIKNPS
jgi:hypothetical protein